MSTLPQHSYNLDTLLPHRPPMLLLARALAVSATNATAQASICPSSLFYIEGKGIPGWVGLEFMGQTAALIAGYQQQQGQLAPHTGFLLGSRRYQMSQAWFKADCQYTIHCEQDTILGESLASFNCCISENTTCHDNPVATAVLTVFRQPTSDTPS